MLADESYEMSAGRELAEELGVTDVPLSFLFDHYSEDSTNRVWGRIFTCRHNGPFVLQQSEVESGMFVSVGAALQRSRNEPFTPDGVEILNILDQGRYPSPTGSFFLHGLDSSGQGTKGRYFEEHFPHIRRPDFSGSLENRLDRLTELCRNEQHLILIGSSFGGLMATSYAAACPDRVDRLILLAPALNFPGYRPPARKLATPCLLVIGRHDTVTPADLVVPLAEATFANLEIRIEDDDHMLHKSFMDLAWSSMLSA
ncbi:MAG: esterase-like protein [uncultured bacterium]|nr:MAG: esterase-like protein [uncultured bacterium]